MKVKCVDCKEKKVQWNSIFSTIPFDKVRCDACDKAHDIKMEKSVRMQCLDCGEWVEIAAFAGGETCESCRGLNDDELIFIEDDDCEGDE